MTSSLRLSLLIAGLMLTASIGSFLVRPGATVTEPKSEITLETAVPSRFGDWHNEPQLGLKIISPSVQRYLDETYSQILERTYVGPNGYRIMLSVAYGPDQRGSLKAHEPEFCYEGQGFRVNKTETSQLTTQYGAIPLSRLLTTKGPRVEPVTYWTMIGDKVVKEWQSRLVELSYTVTGRVPDGLVFRVSSIDPDQERANRLQDQFIIDLVSSLSPSERKRLSGLGDVVMEQ